MKYYFHVLIITFLVQNCTFSNEKSVRKFYNTNCCDKKYLSTLDNGFLLAYGREGYQ